MPAFSRFTGLAESLPPTVPFVGPETQERARGEKFLARLGANESGFGPAPSVIEAITREAPLSWRYADPENHDLRVALGAHLGLAPERVVIGEGIDALLGLLVRLIVEPGTPVVTSLGAYPTFNFHVAGFGGRLITVPYRDDHEDLDALVEAVRRENAPLVYLSNPDNPMGTWHSAKTVTAFAKALPETTLLVLDEAYGETAPASALPAISALSDMPNVLRFRTFSKAYGLAGQRVGYVFGVEETVSMFHRVRNHFGVNRLGQVAARAALQDQAWLGQVVAQVAASRDRIATIAQGHGFTPIASATNFVTIDCGRDAAYAKAVLDALVARGVFIRMPGVAPLNRCIRISTGPEAEIDVFQEALSEVITALDLR
ncbi:pyridoxal phosphate-dependent aminotransferase [Hoeflea sp. YIM 152468]|uniref:pyridoxal phosphate-dependent aminotransferase n=1 Tax=Hoeflea sp. YIM 152468 TaxID=3031759 RepID=UPI0023DAB879|nr:pyridoxal phosphate-dependent aminotransferase [Hoeflea sp. YIM 152468]MDF1607659.1 pyridoxal phosphate-dependent aminotransferase [Hoeflea sp. YIM 152468]